MQSWEEEYFLIDKLNAYKKEHGLPGKLEIDTFDVQGRFVAIQIERVMLRFPEGCSHERGPGRQ